jgi:hypothetical protein
VSSDVLDEEFNMRVNSDQKRRWALKATEEHRSLSAWIRIVCDKASEGVVVPAEAAPLVPVSGPSETRQAEDLAINVPQPAGTKPTAPATKPALDSTCKNAEYHFNLRIGQSCRFCGGYA